jgi:hypothetical protein
VVRETLRGSRSLDSELQVVRALDSGRLRDDEALAKLQAWREVKAEFEPRTEAVWLDDSVLEYAADWLAKSGGLCWAEHVAFGTELSRRTGVPYFGEGGLAPDGRSVESHSGPAIVSIRANSEGRNLQRYSTNLVASPPPSGAIWEQLLGRTHRAGQTADEVTATALVGCAEALEGFEKAQLDAAYIQQTTGQIQRLCVADISLAGVNKSSPGAW